MRLTAGDLTLRPPREDDVPDIVAAFADPDIPRFISLIPVPYGEGDARAWLAGQTVARERGEHDFVVERAGALLGVVSVRAWEGGSVGYWLAPWARGQGVMTSAVRAVLGWARGDLGIARLVLTAHPDNRASQRVAERAGFRLVGRAPHDPPFRDGVDEALVYEIT